MSTSVLPQPPRAPAFGRAFRVLLATLALATLSACGIAMKIGYGQAAPLAFRWLDGFVDFEAQQATRVRAALDDFMAWHRRTQLPDYVRLLGRAEEEIAGDATGAQMCGWVQDLRGRLDAMVERAMPTLVEVLPTLTPQQIVNIETKYAERNDAYRSEFLQRDPAKRRREQAKRELERAESLYGRLDRAQIDLIQRSVADSPLDGERTLAERIQRQQDLLETVRKLAAPGAAPSPREVEQQVRGWLGRIERSPRDDYRRYAERLTEHNCAFAATLHNSTTPAQRRNAATRLKGYGEDFRSLAGTPNG